MTDCPLGFFSSALGDPVTIIVKKLKDYKPMRKKKKKRKQTISWLKNSNTFLGEGKLMEEW